MVMASVVVARVIVASVIVARVIVASVVMAFVGLGGCGGHRLVARQRRFRGRSWGGSGGLGLDGDGLGRRLLVATSRGRQGQ
jgi:hypothetical protein